MGWGQDENEACECVVRCSLGYPVYRMISFIIRAYNNERLLGGARRTRTPCPGASNAALTRVSASTFVTLGRHHVGEAAALGHVDQRIGIPGVFVGDVFDEQQHEDVVLVLAGIHAAAEFVAP